MIEKIVNIAKNFHEAEEWDIMQQISMTPDERFQAVFELTKQIYGEHVKDVRECHIKK